jgi:hypothetical protein
LVDHFSRADPGQFARASKIAVLAVMAGPDGWEDTVVWAKARVSWLNTVLVLSSGVPCPDTFRRVFRAVDPTKFAAGFASMTTGLAGSMLGQIVAIDGKTMRRASARERGQKALHMITVWVAERGVQLGQIATEEKSNEITAIPALLDTLDVRGATVTIDAEGCQKKIAEKMVDGGANHLLVLTWGSRTSRHNPGRDPWGAGADPHVGSRAPASPPQGDEEHRPAGRE